MKRVLGPADFREMPWANGKGVTLELARDDTGGVMRWRLSRARVVEDGPFSVFPEVERNLTVLNGPGFDLVGPGIHLRARTYQPVEFAGDIVISAQGVAAPSDDFNVMTARNLGRARVRVLAGAEHLAAGALLAIYWPETARLILTDEGHDFGGDGPAIAVWLP